MKTIIQFEIVKLSENNFVIDPKAIYVRGWFNHNLLNELLTSENYLNDLGEGMEEDKTKTMTLEIWEDSDDYRSWIDYKVLPDGFEVEG